jgi:hypothetical protein
MFLFVLLEEKGVNPIQIWLGVVNNFSSAVGRLSLITFFFLFALAIFFLFPVIFAALPLKRENLC